MNESEGKNILVLGLGISGLAAAQLALARGGHVWVLDAASGAALDERAAQLPGAEVFLGWQGDMWPRPVDLVVISPGIPPTSDLGRLAAGVSCPVLSELEYGFRECRCPVAAVTGTNGKTTTVELLVHLLQVAGRRVIGAGNIGFPLATAALQSDALDVIVAEVSSFQLEHCDRFAPAAAALLNVTSDHQDRYDGFDDYLQTKLRLFANLRDPRRAVMRHDLATWPLVRALPLLQGGRPVTFTTEPGAEADLYLDDDGWICCAEGAVPERLLRAADAQLIGLHNYENIMAALGVCRALGVPYHAVLHGVPTFAPSPHRMQLVAEHNGVRYINDSKGTNPDAMIRALRSCAATGVNGQPRILLVAGGRDKQMDFAGVIPDLRRYVKHAFLIGETRDQLARLWDGYVPCERCASLAEAVDAAAAHAEAGDTVLLSPGCASFDMFSSYKERGNAFITNITRRLGQ